MNEIKRQLMVKMGDTSERKNKIIKNVNDTIRTERKRHKEKKIAWGYYLTSVIFAAIVIVTLLNLPKLLHENNTNLSEDEPPAVVEDKPEAKDYRDLLTSYYFPPKDLDLFYSGGFEGGGEKVQTNWLSEEFVQQITNNGGATIEKIYKISDDKIELIYENMIDGQQSSSLTLDQLKQLNPIETVLQAPFKVGEQIGEWKIVDLDAELGTFASQFSKVLVLENKVRNTITRKYFAPDFGQVKVETQFLNEETNEYELGPTIELSSYGPIMNEETGNHIFRVFEETQYEIDAITIEKNSPSNTKRAILSGRAEDFEGINTLIIQDLTKEKYTIYRYRKEEEQNTPKDITWIDDNRLYVIVGHGYGTVSMGGDLYELNITNHSITPVFVDETKKEEIMSITPNGDGTFTYKKHVYEDDNYSIGHVEEGVVTPSN